MFRKRPRSGRAHFSAPDAFAFFVRPYYFAAKALNLCDYFAVVTIYTGSTTLYIASFRPPTSS
ncbi:MAG TPA: hypothetical protein VHP37_26120, partial [Burkholderiales bacterium]|nr:hypothetical protein [Burkholderiales bacterium]